MPVLFQDVASIARMMGIQYLWIDALCIIQDSSIDWAEQATTMSTIFEGAAMTVAAASSQHPGVSIFTPRDPYHRDMEVCKTERRSSYSCFKARRKITRGHHAKRGRSFDSDPLDLRAWALQERILPVRLVIFTGAELQWKCRTVQSCECHQSPNYSLPFFQLTTLERENKDYQSYFEGWCRAVEEYSSRDLTVKEDKLPALSGLASKFGDLTGFTYKAGLWEENLVADLVWQRQSHILPVQSTYMAPSWSWASIPGAVNFRLVRHSYLGMRVYHASKICSPHCSTEASIYGRALDGFLTLRGYVTTAELITTEKDPHDYEISIQGITYKPNTNKRSVCEFSIDAPLISARSLRDLQQACTISRGNSGDRIDETLRGTVKLLSLYSIHHARCLYQNFLILGQSRSHLGDYERIGVGTGKLYRDQDRVESLATGAAVGPFEWLRTGKSEEGLHFEDLVEREVRIR